MINYLFSTIFYQGSLKTLLFKLPLTAVDTDYKEICHVIYDNLSCDATKIKIKKLGVI